MTSAEEAGRIYEQKGRKFLADIKQKHQRHETAVPEMAEAAKYFARAGEQYHEAGLERKAEANYRVASRLGKTLKNITSSTGHYRLEVIAGENARDLKEDRLKKRRTATVAIISLIGGLFFLSTNITGNVIGNMTNSTSNIIGAVLLIIGLVGGFFWMRSKK
jgi:hypothetical protein